MNDLEIMQELVEKQILGEISKNKAIVAFNDTHILDQPAVYSDKAYWDVKIKNYKELAGDYLLLWKPNYSELI